MKETKKEVKKEGKEGFIFNTTMVPIGKLKLVDYNPRKQDRQVIEKIKKSISEFGFVNPLVVNKNNNIIGGNQRYIALKELYGKDKAVPVVLLDLDDDKEKALNIALNKISGEFDFNLLAPLLKGLHSINMSDITGFDKAELNLLDIGVSMPEIEVMPSTKTLRFPLTFYFDDIEDKIAVESYFSNKKLGWSKNKEPNTLLLKKMTIGKENGNEKGNSKDSKKKDTVN